MRITNVMVSNTMLSNINRNMTHANKLLEQIGAGSMITRPSDNPLMASRALRISNTQSQIQQHQRNLSQANSWTEVTEQALAELNQVLQQISDLTLKADSSQTLEDKQKIAKEIDVLLDHKASIMNKTYAGRYIFSGLRTDEPPFFNRDQPDLEFNDIVQQFNRTDMESTYVYQKADNIEELGEVVSVDRIRLAYNGDADSIKIKGADGEPKPVKTVPMKDGRVDYSAMTAGGIYHNPETGEIFIGKEAGVPFPIEITYDQKGFEKGDMNPVVFFDCKKVIPGTDPIETLPYTMNNQSMEIELGVNTRIPVNSLAKDIVTAQMFAELRGFTNDIMNMTPTTEEELADCGLSPDEIKEYLQQERDMMETVTNDRFNNLVGSMEGHASNIATQHTDLGTRMARIEMISDRLEEDAVVMADLATNNHGVDVAEMMMKFSIAEVALTASMQVGMNNLTQMTLLNFL